MSEAVLNPPDNSGGTLKLLLDNVEWPNRVVPAPEPSVRTRRSIFSTVTQAFTVNYGSDPFVYPDTLEVPVPVPVPVNGSKVARHRFEETMRTDTFEELTSKLDLIATTEVSGDVELGELSRSINMLGITLDVLSPRKINRRRFLRMTKKVGIVALAAQAPDIWVADRIYNNSHPVIKVQTGKTIPAPDPEYQDEAYVLLPGLGADDASAERMVLALGPHLGRTGHMVSIAYPQNGLGPECWKETAEVFRNTLQMLGIKKAKLVLHSAAGVNAMLMLQAPLSDQVKSAQLEGLELPMIWQYWQEQGIEIPAVALVSSPTSEREIKGALSKAVAEIIGVMPRAVLRSGLAAKFIGNIANAYTHDSYLYHSNQDRWSAITRGTRSNYSPTDWLQQMYILANSRDLCWSNIYRQDTKIGTLTPSDPSFDRVVETKNLSAAWDAALLLKPGTVRSLHDPTIGHGNIADIGVLKYPEQTNRAIRYARMILALEHDEQYIAPEDRI